jgi:hypothetical protein
MEFVNGIHYSEGVKNLIFLPLKIFKYYTSYVEVRWVALMFHILKILAPNLNVEEWVQCLATARDL